MRFNKKNPVRIGRARAAQITGSPVIVFIPCARSSGIIQLGVAAYTYTIAAMTLRMSKAMLIRRLVK